MAEEGSLPPELRELRRHLLSLRTALRAVIGRVRVSPDGTVSLEYDA
jgi:hypothetical protein